MILCSLFSMLQRNTYWPSFTQFPVHIKRQRLGEQFNDKKVPTEVTRSYLQVTNSLQYSFEPQCMTFPLHGEIDKSLVWVQLHAHRRLQILKNGIVLTRKSP
ncbi:hypothetical protein DUNSADRAFT_5613 [Dunaliella salina]|uniref:Uncharacterized protein n=1 Tax=Dunaliella salina TaxID=3046 RepID=A0ABQ7GPW2_DUNSA|nr:hypothetical protein DUNSADRAFT_5613 [Dunaliella salina]|eukprot:KAF5836654.1 hypothetical protein DUNSADRAFT_5613 [Dunaliella salina]